MCCLILTCKLILTYKLILTLIKGVEEKESGHGGGAEIGHVKLRNHMHGKNLKTPLSRLLSFWSEIELGLFLEGRGIIGFSSLSHS